MNEEPLTTSLNDFDFDTDFDSDWDENRPLAPFTNNH